MEPQSLKPPPTSSSDWEAASLIAYCGVLALIFVAVRWPDLPPQSLHGLLWTGLGLLLVLLPPVVRAPRLWYLLAAGFVVMAAAGFLPRNWGHLPLWRSDLESLGLDTGGRLFPQPLLALEHWAGLAITTVAALFLLGHRVGTRLHLRLLLGFSLLVAAWGVLALLHHDGNQDFGFFPNRNHTATLLAMGSLAALGALAQAVRFREGWLIAIAVCPLAFLLLTVFVVSVSRAGMLLVIVGFAAWVALAGKQSLRGHVGKAVLLLALGFLGLFLVVDSPVKTRIGETFGVANGTASPSAVELAEDPRLTIFRDTLAMCAREPWSGVGPGNFEAVFPQYRHFTTAPNESRCLHPESDWLLLLAESGWPATLCVLAGTVAVARTAIRRATLRRQSRPLKTASIVAGLAVAFHGLFDVPGHRVGLAWAAVLLVAMALRPHRPGERHTDPPASVAARRAWRVAGALICAGGVVLLQAQWRGRTILPSAQVASLVAEAWALAATDHEAWQAAEAADLDYEPPPDADPLEAALDCLTLAQAITPLEPSLHHLQGRLAVSFDGKLDLARQAFAIERRLLPTRVSVPMYQARSWIGLDHEEVGELWRETLRRAAANDELHHDAVFHTAGTYRRLVQEAGRDENLGALVLNVADNDPALLLKWAGSAAPPLLNRELPAVISRDLPTDTRRDLLEIWQARSGRAAVEAFRQSLATPQTPRQDPQELKN